MASGEQKRVSYRIGIAEDGDRYTLPGEEISIVGYYINVADVSELNDPKSNELTLLCLGL